MEGVLCKPSSVEIQNTDDREGHIDSKGTLSSIPLNRNLENQEEVTKVNGVIEIGSQAHINGESPHKTENPAQKSYSPTLIGSAIQAVKNLFSPDKTKVKSVCVSSPVNHQISASGSSLTSIYIPGKADIFSSESGMEILNNIQAASGENNLKTHIQITEIGGIPSPITLESHNNTDDSFLTTVSLIDDSFHSAVTHFDEHGEALKNGSNFMDNILNNSQNLDMLDPYNETLENNESCLENTTLKIDCFIPDGSKKCNVSILDADGNVVNMNGNQNRDSLIENGPGKFEDEINQENMLNSSTPKEQLSPRENHRSPAVRREIMNGGVEMSNLFLNRSFESSSDPQKGKVERQSNKRANLMVNNTNLGVNGELGLERTISTTTIVLNSAPTICDRSSKSDDLDIYIPSPGFDARSLSEDDLSVKPALNELNCKLPYLQSVDCSSAPTSNFFTPLPFQEKKCLSEGNSPTHGLNPNKVKFNKSDELINRRILSEPLEGKLMLQEKASSVDISLMKNSEASEIKREPHSFDKVTREHQSEIGENEFVSDKPKPIISQQSYTILNHDNKLNRPVIEPINVSKEPPEEQTFRASEGTLFGSKESLGTNCKNTSFSGEDPVKSSQFKQSTPIWEGTKEGGQKFFRPTTLELHSPNRKEHVKESLSGRIEMSPVNAVEEPLFENDMNGSCHSPSFDPHVTRIMQSKETEENQSLNKSKTSEHSSETVQKLNKTFDKKPQSSKPEKLNRTFQKKSCSPEKLHKQISPTGQKLNHTFDKNSPKSKNLNSTFTKRRDSGEMEKANQTFDISTSPEAAQLNKTYDKPLLNENVSKNLDSSLMNKTQTLESFRNQTFIKEMENTCRAQELNKTFDKNEVGMSCARGSPLSIKLETESKSTVEFFEKFNQTVTANESFSSSNASLLGSDLSTVVLNDELHRNKSVDDLSEKLKKMDLAGNQCDFHIISAPLSEEISVDMQTEEKLLNSLKDSKLGCDPDLVQFIQEQFSPNDIEKICNVVQDMSSLKLSNDIMRASEQFDKSFHGNLTEADFKPPEAALKHDNPVTTLSPQSLDFLNSIRGKPTGRDLSRESLYVKFDPLVQPSSNSLIDFTKEGEAPVVTDAGSPSSPHGTSICEQLLAISPLKKPDDIVPPLTPLSHKGRTDSKAENEERLKELQNEIYFLKNLYSERERSNKAKMEDYENQIAKLTSENCFLEEKLKESSEREKCMAKKMKEQNESLCQLKIVMEDYMDVISKLTGELETLKQENSNQVESLSVEKDSYMTHLQNTEAAFTDVHTKYEKSKKTIVSLKANEIVYRNTIAEQAQKLEEFKTMAREAQEKALLKFHKVQEELEEMKSNHTQETARLRAQLKKTDLKVEALQESLDQKIKENQQLTAICDELIEGRK